MARRARTGHGIVVVRVEAGVEEGAVRRSLCAGVAVSTLESLVVGAGRSDVELMTDSLWGMCADGEGKSDGEEMSCSAAARRD